MASETVKIAIDSSGPILCFGGPYSNLQATEAIRCESERLAIPPSRVICTGDIVAYCAHPNETAELIRDWGCHVIKGNCEEQLSERADDCGCGFGDGTTCDMLSRSWYTFANRIIREELRTWMAGLPGSLAFDLGGRTARVVHGGVSEISRFIFASTPIEEKSAELNTAAVEIIIAGHCGIPFIQQIDERIWFNPGVIGMPANDGTPDGWYGLIQSGSETDKLEFCTRRLNYDAASAGDDLKKSGHANPYADALLTGMWPSLDVLPQAERSASGNPLAAFKFAANNYP